MRMLNNAVHRSRVYEETLQLLGGPNSKMFSTLRDALSFAAALGYHEGRRWKLDEKFGREDIQSSVYNGNDAIDLIFAIALAEAKNAEILKHTNEKDCILIFEEYANGGLALLSEWLETYPDVDIEVAIWKGLKTINFLPVTNTEKSSIPQSIDF